MSKIDAEFVRELARRWHRVELDDGASAVLAEMLAPMDDAGERQAERVGFDMEPASFGAALDELAVTKKGNRGG